MTEPTTSPKVAAATVSMRILRAENLVEAVRAIVSAGGSSAEEAGLVATNLVEANLRGHDSHGIGMVPRYVDALLEGGLAINEQVAIKLDTGALLTLDGRRGYGQVIGRQAMALGIERAQRHGVCIVGLAHSHHLGRIGQWAEQCAAEGLVSIHFVNVLSRPIVAPFGGRDARFGTNPFCVAIPRAGSDPIVLDFATSKIAQGKTRVAYNKGVALEPDTIIDNLGNPTTDPRYTVIEPSGALLTFGGHKGSGLALICELLGGALAGGETAQAAVDGRRRVLNSMFSIIVDPKGARHRREPRCRDGALRRQLCGLAAGGRGRPRVGGGRAGARLEGAAAGRRHPGRLDDLGGDRRRGAQGRRRRRHARTPGHGLRSGGRADMTTSRVLLGCIADDFTGATDLANNLVRAGMRVVQTIGVPAGRPMRQVDAVVVALKSRTIAACRCGRAVAGGAAMAAGRRARNRSTSRSARPSTPRRPATSAR